MSEASPAAVAAVRPFSAVRVLLCLLPLLVLALWILALAGLASAGGTATAAAPARVSVRIPERASSANVVLLEVDIAMVRGGPSGQPGAVVRIRPPGGSVVEVGRISLAGGKQSYQFDVTGALKRVSGGSAEVEVALIDRGGGSPPAGAALSVSRAQIVTR